MEIDKILYKEIKEYCDLNGLNTKDYIHNLLKKAFVADKYGERPGILVFKQDKKEVEKAEEDFKEIVKSVGGQNKYNDIITDLIFDNNSEKSECTNNAEPINDTEQKEKEPKKRKIQVK